MNKFTSKLTTLKTIITGTFIVGLLVACSDISTPVSQSPSEEKISFNQDIRPILNKSCTGCHGGVSKQSGVSFIYREEALGRGHSGRLTIVPGKPNASELIARVESKDPNTRMPYKAPALPEEEIQLLRKWIEQGAIWEEHWAFIPPQVQKVPEVKNTVVINNEIDNFIQYKLESDKLTMAEKADKTQLLRRLSFDLIGLPPSTQEIEEFLADTSAQAYEKQVDRLLASPRYGERWAAMWMDLSRYADSHGYTRDEYRETWPYKQWVIEALNKNMSYKDFMIEQIAGDLLPQRNLDNIIATGFHRQTPSNSEGGSDDEEFRMVAVMDRSATTWSVLNAMTMNCVQCHSHPYDPIKHDEYYQSLSFFNTSKDADYRDYKPLYKLAKNEWQKQDAFVLQENMQDIRFHQANKAYDFNQQIQQSDKPWQKLNIETALADEAKGLREYIEEIAQQSVRLKKQGKKLDHRTRELLKNAQTDLQSLIEQKEEVRAYTVVDGEMFETGSYPPRAHFTLTTTPFEQTEAINVVKLSALPQNSEKARHTPEKSFHIDSLQIFHIKEDGQKYPLKIRTFMSNATEVMDEQLTRLSRLTPTDTKNAIGTAVGWFAHRIYLPRWTTVVLEDTITLKAGERIEIGMSQMQRTMPGDGMPARLHRVRIDATHSKTWAAYANSEERKQHIREYGDMKTKLANIDGYDMPIILEQEPWDQRAMATFVRGNMLAKENELQTPNTPDVFPAFNQAPDRLGLTNWFFEPEQPLTARVAVNRLWQRLFGIGIVETLEDFGSAGTLPNHPELLDWLALEFQNTHEWDVKAILKLMVMSHAYQQDATIQSELYELDPHNKRYARGARKRLSAEMVRDQALMASGLIVHKIGGEPAMPPQPDGIWGHPGRIIKDWANAQGDQRYRRAVYTFIKRAFMYPSFLSFDMETREISHQRRLPTNTPLQALVTLNDPVYHEAAQHLGKIMQADAVNNSDESALINGFIRVVSRKPHKGELQTLADALSVIRTEQEDDASSSTGNTAADPTWTAIASILLNLDDALTR